jgi:hypothetical protein
VENKHLIKKHNKFCKLCLQERELCDSHIIPEFFYKPIYDQKHHLNYKPFDPNNLPKKQFEQKGIREKLLCLDCETKLSRYEKYVSEIYDKKLLAIPKNINKVTVIKLDGINYHKFKLFQLSILWRCGITSQEMFSIILGSHQEILRNMILDDNPGEPDDYGCILSAIVSGGQVLTDFILMEGSPHIETHKCHRIIFGGYIWTYFVSKHQKPTAAQYGFIQKDGTMQILIAKLSEIEFMMKRAEKLYQAGMF